jgi:hypothetical protein
MAILIQLPVTSGKAGQILVIRDGVAKWVDSRTEFWFWSVMQGVTNFFKRFRPV